MGHPLYLRRDDAQSLQPLEIHQVAAPARGISPEGVCSFLLGLNLNYLTPFPRPVKRFLDGALDYLGDGCGSLRASGRGGSRGSGGRFIPFQGNHDAVGGLLRARPLLTDAHFGGGGESGDEGGEADECS